MKKRLEITVENHKLIIMRGRRDTPLRWCRQCTKGVMMLRPEEAAATAGVTVRTVNRWVEAEVVHFDETSDGRLLICANSVALF
jgi:hypothetical protein